MKRLFLFIVTILPLLVHAQTQIPQDFGGKLYRFKNGVKIDSAAFLPRRDTTNADPTMLAPGMLQWRPADQSFYQRDSTGWRRMLHEGTVTGFVPTSRLINTTSPLLGGGDLSADRTLSIQQATGSTDGYLSAVDWTTFNNKIGTAENGLYKSGTAVRLGTSALIENTNIPLSGFHISITGNGSPIGTGASPTYDFQHIHNQPGIVGLITQNNNASGAEVISFGGSGVGISGGLGMYNPAFTPAFENSYTQPGFLQLASGSSANGVAVRSINASGELRLMIDTVSIVLIDSSNVVPGTKAVRLRPKVYPEGDLELVNYGNTVVTDSTIHGVRTGLVRFNWALIGLHGMHLDLAASKWRNDFGHLGAAAFEAGAEGISLHAARAGTDFSDQLHEGFQVRNKGIDFANGSAEWDTGKVNQSKLPLVFKHDTRTYNIAGDASSWEQNDTRPFIVMMAEETKSPAGEYMRLEQNSATTGGGQIYFKHSRGTSASKTASLAGDFPGHLKWANYDGDEYITGSTITSILETTATNNNAPAALRFETGSNGTTEKMRITSGGLVLINTTTSGGTRLQVNGGIATAIATVTGNTTLDATHSTVRVNNTGVVTITLPAASGAFSNGVGRIYTIKKVSAASNDVNISTADGGTKVLTLQNSAITVQSNGTTWDITAGYASATVL